MKTLMCIAGALALFTFSNLSKATLIGQDVDYLHEFSSIGNQFRFAEGTVEAGVDDTVTFGGININVEADSIIFSTGGFNGRFANGTGMQPANRVSVLDLFWAGIPGGIITGITTVATFDTAAAGLEASDLVFDEHSVSLDLQGQFWGSGNSLTVFLQTNHTTGEPGAVPAPGTIVLFGLGLLGLGWSRRTQA